MIADDYKHSLLQCDRGFEINSAMCIFIKCEGFGGNRALVLIHQHKSPCTAMLYTVADDSKYLIYNRLVLA